MEKIEIKELKKMFHTGFSLIADNYEIINDLNIFPVPDGDTGTNLKITTSEAWKEIAKVKIDNISLFGQVLSRSLLMNARGNSGVIFSQIIRGFVSALDDSVQAIDISLLIECFLNAKKAAYESVEKPVEGTILTIIRDVAEALNENKDKFTDINQVLKYIVEVSKVSLNNTPNLLPALKKADVVDSGGYGLWCFLLGIYKSFDNDISEYIDSEMKNVEIDYDLTKEIHNDYNESPKIDEPEKGFGYCSELIIKIDSKISPESDEKKPFNFKKFKEQLLKMGESLVCIQDNDLVKVHLHTLTPGSFLNFAQRYGEFIKIKIENMTEQFYERLQNRGVSVIDKFTYKLKSTNLSLKPALLITSPSKKISEIFANEYEFKNIIDCSDGNPSIEKLFLSIQATNSRNVILVVDDSNMLLAANQAKGLLEGNINVKIIVTSNALESLVCSLEYDENSSLTINEKNMTKALRNINSGSVSMAKKDVTYSNVNIKKDDYIAIIKKKVIAADADEFFILKTLIDNLFKQIKHADVLMIFYENNDQKTQDILEKINEYAENTYGLVCDFKEGKQKVYNYYVCLQ